MAFNLIDWILYGTMDDSVRFSSICLILLAVEAGEEAC
jgi:hypothetical protein